MRLQAFHIFIKMLILEDIVNLNKLNKYTSECLKQSKWKKSSQLYIANKTLNNLQLREDILKGTYKISPTNNFILNERGKIRNIESPAIRDRIIQKSLTKQILLPQLCPHLIYDNYASLKHRGVHFARKRFEIMLRDYINKNGTNGFILLGDIVKYFENIDHDILKEKLSKDIKNVSDEVLELIFYIIDCSSKFNKGLNLGSEVPQVFAIYYLNELDQYIKVVKSIKYYGRYMDDFFIIVKSKEKLLNLLKQIQLILKQLKLNLNLKKTHIIKLTHGFTFLQIKYNILSNKIIKRISHSKIVRERKRIKKFKQLLDNKKMSIKDIENCYKSWRGSIISEHNSYKKSLYNLDNLYKILFNNECNTNCKRIISVSSNGTY